MAEERRQRTTELLERMGMNPSTTPPPPPAPTSNPSQSPQQPQPPQPEVPYYQRLYNDHVRHQQRIQQARDDIAAEEAAHAPSFSPHINSTKDVERVLPGEGDLSQRLETWRKRRNERRVEAQNQIVREQESLMRETPEINAYSHELADELIADGKRHPDVSEHLYSLAPDFDKKVEWMKAQQMAAEVPATPAITRMAMSLEREGPVGDRLYEAALETRAKLLKQRQESSKKDNYNAARGHPSPIVVQKQRSKVIGHNLYDLAVKQRKKKDSMRKKKQLAIEQKQNIKHITKTSVKLVEGREEPLVRLAQMTPTQKRELQIWKIRRDEEADQLRDARDLPHQKGSGFHLSDLNDEELTFQPAVNPLSAQIAAVRNSSSGMTNVSDRLHAESKTWRKKSIAQLKKQLQEEEMKECTFTPNTKKSKKTFHTSLGYDVGGGADEKSEKGARSSTDTPDRLSRWQEQRDRKILKMQTEKAQKVNEHCTFQPNLNRAVASNPNTVVKVLAGNNGPTNTRRRSLVQQNNNEDRQRRARQAFYARQKTAQAEAERLRTALSPHKPLHMHPTLHSKTAAHVIANQEIGDGGTARSPVDQHMNRMVKARANRAMRRNSQLKNQLRNPWSISGSTNPDFISVNAEAAPVPKDHIPRTTEKQKDGFRHRALRPPVMPGDFGMEMIPKKLATSERISPKSVPLPRY